MCRSDWELEVYVRHHIAELAGEYQVRSHIVRDDDVPASLVSQLRHRLGLVLIQAGHALAGDQARHRLTTPPVAAAKWAAVTS